MVEPYTLAALLYVIGVVLAAVLLGAFDSEPVLAPLWPALLPLVAFMWALETLGSLGVAARKRWEHR